MNMFYKKVKYISWKNEAKHILLSNDDMRAKIKEVKANRTPVQYNTRREDFTESTYKISVYGDYAELYMKENGEYVIYCNNLRDAKKNSDKKPTRVDRLFNKKFMELNGCGLEKAYGFVDKSLKRCIPKQFIYINKKLCNKKIIASSVDASSQYPSGCLGSLPDAHTSVSYKGKVLPTKDYPFAFYASGHIAIFNELDTHDWFESSLWPYLFRLDRKDPWPFRPLPEDQEETILMKASHYTMDETWKYYYTNKQNCLKDSSEYELAKLVMNQVIGDWHRKDKDQKRIMTYDDNGSFQLAHIVAVAIARGNQKILNKIEQINLDTVAHVCVDGIIYIGDRVFGVPEAPFGVFRQEFHGAEIVIKDINVYCVRQNGHCIKFKHAGYDLLNNEEIDESRDFEFNDLACLNRKERIGELIKNE